MQRSRESEIQAAICDYLALKGYLFSRTNNTPVFDKARGIHRSLPKYTRRGWPDICLIRNGQFIGIEVKAEKGKLSDDQKELGREIETHGGRYVVARSIDDLIQVGL
ncbi:VRR-NUC domain-containing protein [Bradyrhizobium diazoefficiens]|uniref:VRR-NUC domain-containing protein n=1 Tax=Bradyrhizobium diazoefficiens TaxID=1355477 RepID=UPI00190CE98F|nr:VRR-NUC domain-containing protein [Bradyrhizobium diazoefficiens]MBK3666190.1 VRR-NUC domain-containing protein [Bradyrhizobium diazoefficiens]